ncbi:MAG: polyisoprenoid-binding protein [Bdellovibrionales bacterium]|nr:polyisoprenoid-binding protein [Bdellovibrionales bacterium]
MKIQSIVIAGVTFFSLMSSVFASTKYTLDTSHSTVGFKVPHLMISSVQGRFDKFEGTFSFDEKTGKVDDLTAKIDLDSVNTNDPKRDKHLKNEDFFGVRLKDDKLVENKRWMTFTATKVDVKNKKPNTIKGDLTLNGVTKPVTLAVNYKGTVVDPWGNSRLGFEATGKLSRKDYKITWNKALETGGVVVGDEVTIVIDGEAIADKSTIK